MSVLKASSFCGLVCLSLAGCMGDEGSGGSGAGGPLSFSQQIGLANRLADEITVLNGVAPQSLPDTGTATYAGNLGLSLMSGTADAMVLYGSLDLEADFATNSVTGSVTDFVDTTDTAYTGAMQLTNGQINDTNNANSALTADITGSITNPDNVVYTSNATMTGGFFGPGESHVQGSVTGSIVIDGNAVAIDNGAFAGAD